MAQNTFDGKTYEQMVNDYLTQMGGDPSYKGPGGQQQGAGTGQAILGLGGTVGGMALAKYIANKFSDVKAADVLSKLTGLFGGSAPAAEAATAATTAAAPTVSSIGLASGTGGPVEALLAGGIPETTAAPMSMVPSTAAGLSTMSYALPLAAIALGDKWAPGVSKAITGQVTKLFGGNPQLAMDAETLLANEGKKKRYSMNKSLNNQDSNWSNRSTAEKTDIINQAKALHALSVSGDNDSNASFGINFDRFSKQGPAKNFIQSINRPSTTRDDIANNYGLKPGKKDQLLALWDRVNGDVKK